jgi:hypothetical protein
MFSAHTVSTSAENKIFPLHTNQRRASSIHTAQQVCASSFHCTQGSALVMQIMLNEISQRQESASRVASAPIIFHFFISCSAAQLAINHKKRFIIDSDQHLWLMKILIYKLIESLPRAHEINFMCAHIIHKISSHIS